MESKYLGSGPGQAPSERHSTYYYGNLYPGTSVSYLNSLPEELALEIMKLLPHTDLCNLALVSKRLRGIIKESLHLLLGTSLRCQPEFETLLLLHTFDKLGLQPEAIMYPRNVYYDYTGLEHRAKMPLLEGEPLQLRRRTIKPQTLVVDRSDMVKISNSAKIIDWWVDAYPRLHWRDDSSNRRSLRPAEVARLRMAIARLWFYSSRHHGVRHRTPTQPKPWSNDRRLYHVRGLSTNELFELLSVQRTLGETIRRDLCSSVKQVDEDPVPWGLEDGRDFWIVSTYLKLDPQRLRSFLLRYPIGSKRSSIVLDVSREMRDFSFCKDIETLQISIWTILFERGVIQGGSFYPRLGIVDEERVLKSASLDDDASPTGSPTTRHRGGGQTFHLDVPHGDDGRDLSC
ncbi:hypothetical protein F5B20DRAFT_319069 [Whalleya microplaca]|nr:hypothetical protein F5B20DRAFT_319069 [Whalleya microplaca]